jgi:hypothetical protein
MARVLAKTATLRPSNAIELGEAFRSALDLPETAGWQAQQEFAALARTVSGLDLPAVPPTQPDLAPFEPEAAPAPIAPADPAAERAEELRRDVVNAFTTQPIRRQ